VKFKSSKASIASVDANGMVTGKKAGTVTITATTYNGVKATIKITVRKAPSSVKITNARSPLGIGEEIQLKYSLSSGSSGLATFESSNNDVVFANSDGSLLAITVARRDKRLESTLMRAGFEVSSTLVPASSRGKQQRMHSLVLARRGRFVPFAERNK
jgi:hypothetical protein